MDSPSLKIVSIGVDAIKERPGNARTHGRKQLAKLASAIRSFGFVVPVLIDSDNILIAGHGRLQAAKSEGLKHVPAIYLRHLSKEQIRALTIADNRIAELAGWDKKTLAKELSELVDLLPMPELLSTGFELEEIELLQDAGQSQAPQCQEEHIPAVNRATPATSRLGDCWLIGDDAEHKLGCLNALESESYVRLLGQDRADLVVTDPPYNRKVNGEILGAGRIKRREFVMASGELSRTEFQRFLTTMCMKRARFTRSGSLHYIFIDWRSVADLLAAGEGQYHALLNLIVWVKSNGAGMGSFYRSQHELVALFKSGKRPHKNRISLGSNGRNRANVWQYPGANAGSREDLKMHPTVKNLEMITDAIRDGSDPGDMVLDPFGGSGTLLLAAHRSGRRARIMELDPHYCDLILSRARIAGLTAQLQDTRQSYDEVAAARLTERKCYAQSEEQAA